MSTKVFVAPELRISRSLLAETQYLWKGRGALGRNIITHTLSADSFFCPAAKLDSAGGSSSSRPKRGQVAAVPEKDSTGSSGLESLAAALTAVNTCSWKAPAYRQGRPKKFHSESLKILALEATANVPARLQLTGKEGLKIFIGKA